MGVKERRERVKLETRELILEAARELFVTEGYEGVSMRKVAEKIEYSPTALYLHFADKAELFHELCQQDFARLAERLVQIEQHPDLTERIRQTGLAYVQFGLEFPNHYKLMFMTAHPPMALQPSDKEIKGNPEKDAYSYLRQLVQQGIEQNLFRPEVSNADLISQTLWGAMHGVISLQIAKHGDAWVDWTPIQQRAEVMAEAVLRGLLKEQK